MSGSAPVPRLALVTCEQLGPAPEDEALLGAALLEEGVECEWVAWDEPGARWATYDGALIRTAWNYTERVAAFRQWATDVGAMTSLWNPPAVVAWNSHKAYLLELAAQNVSIVPTRVLAAADPGGDPESVLAEWSDVVVKPAVGAGASGTSRWVSDVAGAAGAIRALLAGGFDVLVQPFLADVARTGETSVVFVDGEMVHAVAKTPAAGDYRSQPQHGGVLRSVRPTPAQVELSHAALRGAARCLQIEPDAILYARIDCVDLDGEPLLMELELIEPDLFFALDAHAPTRLASAVKRRLERAQEAAGPS